MKIIEERLEQEEILDNIDRRLPDHHLVLDLGGGAYPLYRANWVVDLLEFDKRESHGHYGVSYARFTRDSWICSDLCGEDWSRRFDNKTFDLVFCGHTLEDIECPSRVVGEMCRIGKSCVIYSPHWTFEVGGIQKYFTGDWKGAGYSHHLWLLIPRHDMINFVRKPKWLTGEEYSNIVSRNVMIMWDDDMSFREVSYDGIENRESFIDWIGGL